MPHDEIANSMASLEGRLDGQDGHMAEDLAISGAGVTETSPHKCAQCAGEPVGPEIHDRQGLPRAAAPLTSEPELASAVNMLAQVALQMEDPVQALEDGVDALAEALLARHSAAQREGEERQLQQRQQEAGLADMRNAYRHARMHRVGELVDVGYSLDQAIAITDANEAEIRERSQSAGRNPNAVIYEYAIRHGYRPRPASPENKGPAARAAKPPAVNALERLASLPDDAFAEATRGDRWERLLKAGK